MRPPDLTEQQIIAYAAGELDGESAARVEAHLAADPAARARVTRYRTVQRTMAGDDTMPVPPEVTARARQVFARMVGRSASTWLQRLDALVARLVFDSRLQPAAVRHGDPDDRFQLAWESEAADVDVHARRLGTERGAARWRIMGQVSAGAEAASYRVAVLPHGEDEPLHELATDDAGVFAVELPTGTYDLCIDLPERMMRLPDMTLP